MLAKLLIPKPVSAKSGDGSLKIAECPAIKGDASFSREIEAFRDDLESDFGKRPSAAASGGISVVCQKEGGLAEEAYRLAIGGDEIKIRASSGAGLWHGLQTLRQLLLSGQPRAAYPGDPAPGPETGKSGFSCAIPLGEIEDEPRYSWRGLMLDSARYFYTKDFVKKLLRALSLYHINKFHWHLTDDQGWRFPVEGYPLLTEIGSRRRDHRLRDAFAGGGFYTEGDIREIVEFAAARHIEIVPEIDIPGHASSILAAYPGLGCTGGPYRVEDRFGIFEDVLCAGNDQIFDLSGAAIDALAKLFPSKYVHIGGDEVRFNHWEACPKCRKRLAETGLKTPRELQSWITVKLAKMLAERGKIGIGWDEILEDSERYKLPREVIVMSWRGREGGLKASRLGHQVIMTPNTEGCYLDYRHNDDVEELGRIRISRVSQIYNMSPASPEMGPEEAARVLGGQGNLWSEVIYAGKIAEYMIFPRICALSEALWSPPESKSLEDFAKRLEINRARLDHFGIAQYRGAL